MDNIVINISINDDNDLILNFDSEEKIKIETVGDIDLSEYVNKLTNLIDKRPRLDLNELEIEDPKLKLIQETIVDITSSFNESIGEDDEQVDDE